MALNTRERNEDTMRDHFTPIRMNSTEKITSANKIVERLESAGSANRSVR